MTACRLPLKLQGAMSVEGGGGEAGLQSPAIFMGHVTGTGREKPDGEDLKIQAPNVLFRGNVSPSVPCDKQKDDEEEEEEEDR